jgi:hypothetical protein
MSPIRVPGAKERLKSLRENRKETADLSTALRSGRDDKVVTKLTAVIHRKTVITPQQLCHLDRSAAQWRDLRFLFPVLTQTLKPDLFSYGPTKQAAENLYESRRDG